MYIGIASRWRPLYHKQPFFKLDELSTDTDANNDDNDDNDK